MCTYQSTNPLLSPIEVFRALHLSISTKNHQFPTTNMGLDRCRFKKSELTQHLLCCVCCEVLSSPVQCSLCRLFLCKPCIGSSAAEAQCQHTEFMPVSKFLSMKLKEMELKCRFYPHGCEAWCRVKDAWKHESRCSYACKSEADGKENAYSGAEKLNCSDCKTKLVLCREGCGRVMSAAEAKKHNCLQGLISETRKKAENLRYLREKLANAAQEKHHIEEQLQAISQTVTNQVKSLEMRLEEVENEKRRAEEEYEERLLASESLCEVEAGGFLRQEVDLLGQIAPAIECSLAQAEGQLKEAGITLGRKQQDDLRTCTMKITADVCSFMDSKPKPPKFISQFRPKSLISAVNRPRSLSHAKKAHA